MGITMDLQKIYENRFGDTGIAKRKQVWQTLCAAYFAPLIGPDKDIIDLGCGYGEFINNISARSKTAVDMNTDSVSHLDPDIRFLQSDATKLDQIADSSADVVFTSNFLEHLPSKEICDQVFAEVRRALRVDGRFIILGPNIRYAYKEYWDRYDHLLPLSHLSLEEGLLQGGFKVVQNIARFLPLTMQSRLPTFPALIRLYVSCPIFWPLFAKQFLVIAQK
jgi:SAM-dependent methyltransferase